MSWCGSLLQTLKSKSDFFSRAERERAKFTKKAALIPPLTFHVPLKTSIRSHLRWVRTNPDWTILAGTPPNTPDESRTVHSSGKTLGPYEMCTPLKTFLSHTMSKWEFFIYLLIFFLYSTRKSWQRLRGDAVSNVWCLFPQLRPLARAFEKENTRNKKRKFSLFFFLSSWFGNRRGGRAVK